MQCLSINATQSMEQVAAAGKDCPLLMFNIYIFRDRGFTSRVLRSMPFHHDPLCQRWTQP